MVKDVQKEILLLNIFGLLSIFIVSKLLKSCWKLDAQMINISGKGLNRQFGLIATRPLRKKNYHHRIFGICLFFHSADIRVNLHLRLWVATLISVNFFKTCKPCQVILTFFPTYLTKIFPANIRQEPSGLVARLFQPHFA